jgi:hypothetical protein
VATTTAGLTKGARITGADRQAVSAQLAERYQAGESIRALAQETGRSFGFVHGVIKESGVPLRGRGGATRRSTPTAAPGASSAAAPTAKAAVDADGTAKPRAAKSKKADVRKAVAKKSEPKKSAAKKDEAKKDEVKKEKGSGKKKGRS